MSKVRDAFSKDFSKLLGAPITGFMNDDSVLKAIMLSVKRGSTFEAGKEEEVANQDEILRILFSSALTVVADELGLWTKVNRKLKELAKNHPYIIEQLGEPLDFDDSMDLQDGLMGWLGCPHHIREWQAAIMNGQGMATIPRRPLPGEDFERVDMISGERGYERDTTPYTQD